MTSLLLIIGTDELALITNDNAPNHSVLLKNHIVKDTDDCIDVFDRIFFKWYEVKSWEEFDSLIN